MKNLIIILTVMVVVLATTGVLYTRSAPQDTNSRSISRSHVSAKQQTDGRIEGRVINASGIPVSGAYVFANSDGVGSSLDFSSITDGDGNFRIQVPEAGTYTVGASKESDGYPLTISGFHREFLDPIPRVEVMTNQVVKDVIVQLGEKAAKIEGVVRAAADNRAISRATFTLRREDNPDVLYRIGAQDAKEIGRFEILVPSVAFTIEVTSSGYEPWKYGKDSQSSLKLNRG